MLVSHLYEIRRQPLAQFLVLRWNRARVDCAARSRLAPPCRFVGRGDLAEGYVYTYEQPKGIAADQEFYGMLDMRSADNSMELSVPRDCTPDLTGYITEGQIFVDHTLNIRQISLQSTCSIFVSFEDLGVWQGHDAYRSPLRFGSVVRQVRRGPGDL